MINICIFEDENFQNLFPLTFIRPVYDLLLGADTLYNKIHRYFKHANISLNCRAYIKPIVKQAHPKIPINNLNKGLPCLFINGALVVNDEIISEITSLDQEKNHLFVYKGNVVAVFVQGEMLDYMQKVFTSIPKHKDIIQTLRPNAISKEFKNIKMINNLWDLIKYNSETLKFDFKYKNNPGIIKGEIHPYTAIYNEKNVYIGKGTVVEDFVVINANNGPVYIEEDAYIESGTRLEGPIYIGSNSKVFGGKIKNTSIGNYCKVAGEVSDSIFSSYSNKAHSGFVGHSYVGSWVNLGASTTTSNLKNTYGEINLDIAGEKIFTDQIFIGSFIGDHVKTGIGTKLNTGSVIGFGSNIYGLDLHQKYIPPFSWGQSQKYQLYDLDKFISTAEKAMSRRSIDLTKSEVDTITYLYSNFTQNRG
jgi:UDP-N-acetylglucosamine diphosphorylase / glucose-1-phosphate thymidylyltransferase / UDP-N-acetylgalactosamine diphosphorylase / glucosamine-1-phosphate N-acetyltransferase / galactosamine-1-phosphate N-acetyltransferase